MKKFFERALQQSGKRAQENSQAIARVVFAFLAFGYFNVSSIFHHSHPFQVILLSNLFLVYSIANLFFVRAYPDRRNIRKIANIVGDLSVNIYLMHLYGMNAVVVYPVLLWIIVGNGMRFGIKYLFFALAYTEVAMFWALKTNPAWVGHANFIYSLSIGLIVLSLFYAKMIQRMHQLTDTLEKKVAERVAEIEYGYLHDALTDLKNRNALTYDLEKEKFAGLILLDIDAFHNYNALYGMQSGNRILKRFGEFLKTFAAENGYEAYRISGDLFVLRSKGTYPSHMVMERDIQAIFTQLEELKIEIPEMDDILKIDITIGGSLEEEMALKKAEMALNYAKKRHLLTVFYSKRIDSASYSQEMLSWKNVIKEAISTDNIVPVYQAIVDRDRHIVKYESLMRIRRKEATKEELISPFYFLDIAIKSKLYSRLTHRMIEKTFHEMQKHRQAFTLNLTFEDIMNKKTVDLLKQYIQEHQVGKRLTLEIVESEDIEDFAYAKAFVEEFRKLGVRVAIDDFGTGYSNFSHIFELSPDFLKIDGSLIKNIDKDRKSYELVKSVISFSKTLGIETIAEFVSSKKIFDICYDLGVDMFQGYYFCEPLPEERLAEFEASYRKQWQTA